MRRANSKTVCEETRVAFGYTMSEEKDGGFFTSKRGSGEFKDRGSRSDRDDIDAKLSAHQSEQDVEDEAMLSEETKPPRRASVGWGTEAAGNGDEKQTDGGAGSSGGAQMETKRGGRRRKGGEGGGSASDSSARKNRHFDDDQESTDIVEIPDLEEEEREPDITTQVAEAPRNVTRAVQSLKELDRDIKFALPSTASLGVDLSLLTSVLCPEKAVVESDDNWNFDSLLNEVSQEMQKDLDEREELMRAEGA